MLHRNTMPAEFFGPTRGGNKCLILYSRRNHATIGLTGVGGRWSIVGGGGGLRHRGELRGKMKEQKLFIYIMYSFVLFQPSNVLMHKINYICIKYQGETTEGGK